MIPLAKGPLQAVIIGDHKQLGPTIQSPDAHKLKTTLFQRLISAGIPVHVLAYQYRMHPEIAAFPSEVFYNGQLKDGIDRAARPMLEGTLSRIN